MATTQDKVAPELGNLGVSIDFDSIYSDSERDLSFPHSIKTFNKMSNSSVISGVLSAINTIAGQAQFYVDSYDQSTTHLNRKKFVEQCLFNDMEYSFNQVVRDYFTSAKYGFSVLEKVFRERRYEEGSIYNDGRIGIKYLPLRSQRTIQSVNLDKDNRTIKSITQVINKGNVNLNVITQNILKTDVVEIPIDRVLYFRVNPSSDNIYGRSPLADAYSSWRVLEELRDIELVSANRNLNGIPHLSCPSEIMDEDENDPTSIARVRKMKEQMAKLSNGEQGYIITASDRYDQSEGASAQYDFKLVTGSSSHLSALSGIITRTNNEVFQAMCADILTIDDSKSASSSLTSNKQTMFNMFVEARLNEFVEVINSNLIPDLFRRNGWDITKTPKIKFGRIEKLTIAELAKAIQQLSATQKIPITPDNINHIMEVFGFPYRVDINTSFEDLTKILGHGLDMQSRSGDGMKLGTSGDGTAKSVSSRDKNADNLDKS